MLVPHAGKVHQGITFFMPINFNFIYVSGYSLFNPNSRFLLLRGFYAVEKKKNMVERKEVRELRENVKSEFY